MRNPSLSLPVAALCAAALLATPAAAILKVPAPGWQAARAAIAKSIANPARPADERARDKYRHPAETLGFFGLAPDQNVVELYPSGGWYLHILAPLVAAKGHYIAAVPPGAKSEAQAHGLLAPIGGNTSVVAWDAKAGGDLAPAGTVDRVLTFRNIHNMLMDGDGDGTAPAFFAAAFRALKHGGVLGIVEHHLPEGMDKAREKTSGYVKRSTVIRLATAAGFRPGGESNVNANPKDKHDWPKGVWTLPPTYELGAQDRAKYAAVGESDRMTIKFVKP